MVGIIRGHGIVLKSQAEGYAWLNKLYPPEDIYIISEEKLRDERDVSENSLKFIGYMHPIQVVALDKNNIGRFLNEDIKKFDIIIEQGEHFPLSMLINKYAKKHGVLTIDVHQANDYYDKYFEKSFRRKAYSYINLLTRLRFREFRHLWYVLYKYDPFLFWFVLKNFTITGFRFFRSLPDAYKFDKCFLYGEKFRRIYKTMGYGDDEIVIHGDHDLTKYERYNGERYSSEKPYIIYIDSHLVEDASFHNEFNELAASLINEGYDFFFYPHPNLSDVFLKLLDDRIKVLPRRSIEQYLENADFVFIHNSNMVHLMVYAGKRFCFIYGPRMLNGYYLKLQTKVAEELGVPNEDVRNRVKLLDIVNNYQFDENKYSSFLKEYCGDGELHKKGSDTVLIETLSRMLKHQRNGKPALSKAGLKKEAVNA